MLNIRLPKLRKPGMLREEKGFTLVEVIISIVLLSLIAAAVAGGLFTSSKALVQNDSLETAKNLAETQMEWVKNLLFIPGTASYSPAPIPSEQNGYTATITVIDGTNTTAFPYNSDPTLNKARNSNLQKITVKIFRNGSLTYTLEGYKVE